MPEKSRQKFKYLENKGVFKGGIKSVFITFKELLVAKNCLKLESGPLREYLERQLFPRVMN